MQAIYSIRFDSSGAAMGGLRFTGDPDIKQYQDNEIECTEDQFNSYQNYALVSGEIVAAENSVLTAVAQSAQQKILELSCQAEIVSGFTSSALGDPHRYPSTLTDQQNLSSAAMNTMLPKLAKDWSIDIWCADESGAWAKTTHSATQVQQVARDCHTFIETQRAKYNGLLTQLKSAETVADVQKVLW